jgi:CRP-like cAMP-binding protein
MDSAQLAQLDDFHGPTFAFRAGTSVDFDWYDDQAPKVIVSGWLARFRTLPDGQRRILGFIIPGDFLDGPPDDGDGMASIELECLTDTVLADVSRLRHHVEHAGDRDPLVAAVKGIVALDRGLMLNAIDRLSRQSGYERLVHLFLDLAFRLRLVGLTKGHMFPCPATQPVLAEALSLSTVQVCRLTSQLRRDGLAYKDRRRVTILNEARAMRVAQYVRPAAYPSWTDRTGPFDRHAMANRPGALIAVQDRLA